MKHLLIAALKSSAGTLVNLLSSAIAVKIIAVFAGPGGIGLFSMVRQIQQTASIAGAMGGQSVVVQSLAGTDGNDRVARTGRLLRLVIITSLLTAILLFLIAPLLAPSLLPDMPGAVTAMRLTIVPVLCGSILLFLNGIINSQRAVGALAVVQVIAGLTLAAFAYTASVKGNPLAFVALLATSSGAGILTAWLFCRRYNLLALEKGWLSAKFDGSEAETIRLGLATLATGLVSTAAVLLVRAKIIHQHGYVEAGIFDAAWTLSMTYVMLILTSFSAYYLPTLGRLKDDPEKRNQLIVQYFKFACVASIPLIAGVIIVKPWLIELMYSSRFSSAARTMQWMLLGDFFKVSAWVMAMPMVAYADIKPFLLSEMAWNISFVAASYVLLSMGAPIEAVGMVFFVLYILYFAYCFFYCRSKHAIQIQPGWMVLWCLGFLALAFLSLLMA